MKAIPLPSADELRQLLDYDESTGLMRWKVSPNWSIKAESLAGRKNRKGYIDISIGGKCYKAHRIIWALKTGRDPGALEIDHIDRCKSNNRFSNLRLATRKMNNENISTPITNTSGRKGVSFDVWRGKWGAYIYNFKRKIHLGYFSDIKDAIYARECGEALYTGITGEKP